MNHLFSLIVAAALTGCGALVCTEMGCSGSLAVEVDGALEGLVEVELEDDTGLVTCTFDTATDAPPTCDDDATSLDLTEAGFVLARSLGMGEQPDEVTVRVFEDGAAVLDETFAPAWSEPLYPNGEACDDGGCVSAEEAFTF